MDNQKACPICERPATGIHYGVLSCRGCKMFYKRGLTRKPQYSYSCHVSNAAICSTMAGDRSRCKGCRFQKCIEMGMEIKGLSMRHRKPRINNTSSAKSDVPVAPPIKPTPNQIVKDFLAIQDMEADTISDHSSCSDNMEILSDDFYLRDHDESCVSVDQSRAPGLMEYARRFTFKMNTSTEFIPILDGTGHLEYNQNKLQIGSSVYAVGAAVEAIFGDQIVAWTLFMDRALFKGQVPTQPETSLEDLIEATNLHNCDFFSRVQRFSQMLPGINELNYSKLDDSNTGWKRAVYWLIHHSPFRTEVESYLTFGPRQFHYGRYWSDLISEWAISVFGYKFSSEFNSLQLTQTERYVLLAVVMVEPGEEDPYDLKQQGIHRHYTTVLLDILRQRCADAEEVKSVCRKLERFFDTLKIVHQMYQQYFGRVHKYLCTDEPDTKDAKFGPHKTRCIQLKYTTFCQRSLIR